MPVLSETGENVPGELDHPTKPGLYLAAYHGRESVDRQMDDWGSSGPLFGPLISCHTTYARLIRLQFESASDEARLFRAIEFPHPQHLRLEQDLILYNGVYYGDWSLFVAGPDDCDLPADTFRQAARREPAPPCCRSAKDFPAPMQGTKQSGQGG
jgi:hypothetical protein